MKLNEHIDREQLARYDYMLERIPRELLVKFVDITNELENRFGIDSAQALVLMYNEYISMGENEEAQQQLLDMDINDYINSMEANYGGADETVDAFNTVNTEFENNTAVDLLDDEEYF